MIDMDEIKGIQNELWSQNNDGKSFQAAGTIMEAIELLAISLNEIHKDIAWIKRRLNNEI